MGRAASVSPEHDADARGAHDSAGRRTSQRAPAGAGGPRPERGVACRGG
jgi:hypothetical protein